MRSQITALILSPSFPGWVAPMRFNPVRFEELLSFAGTLCCAWVMSSLLIGGYRTHATSGANLGDTLPFDNPLCFLTHTYSPAC